MRTHGAIGGATVTAQRRPSPGPTSRSTPSARSTSITGPTGVSIVGDAGYCPTSLTGLGTSPALVGAYVLAGEFAVALLDVTSRWNRNLVVWHEALVGLLEVPAAVAPDLHRIRPHDGGRS